MRTINVTFTDEEYEQLNEKKEESGTGWHDFILLSTGVIKKKDLKK